VICTGDVSHSSSGAVYVCVLAMRWLYWLCYPNATQNEILCENTVGRISNSKPCPQHTHSHSACLPAFHQRAQPPPPDTDGDAPFLNQHAEPKDGHAETVAMGDMAPPLPHNPHAAGPNDGELAAAKALADNALALVKAHEERKAALAVVIKQEKYYSDVDLPSSWKDGDWTGLAPGQALTATLDEKRVASVKRYAFNAMRSAELPLRRPLRDFRSGQCQSQVRCQPF
jgi:hypothetical protein